VLNYYSGENVCDLDFEDKFCKHVGYSARYARPYVISADDKLVEQIGYDMIKGVTISAPGFYAPQGRWVRLQPQDPELNAKIRTFDYNGEKITNYEMESSAVAGLSRLLGHRAMTVCCIIAGRTSGDMNTEYHGTMEKLVETVLQRLMK
jgi:uridine phosphorylase